MVVASLVPITSGFAQNTQPNDDKLKKLLEEKFIPPKSSTQTPPAVDKKDLHWIAPKTAPPSGRQGGLTPEIGLLAVAGDSRPYVMRYQLANNLSVGLTPARTDALEIAANSRAQISAPSGRMKFAQAVAKRNVYIIQLKSGATQQQINSLLAKYSLTVTGGNAAYYILKVERTVAAASSTEVEKLSDVLNQQIIAQLRREPIVASATVDTTVKQHSIPQASNTRVGGDGSTITWSWTNNTSTIVVGSASPSTTMPTPQTDGNWGLKMIRMPPVWTIVQRYRDAKPNVVRPKLAIIDTGFAKHEDLAINFLDSPNDTPITAVASAIGNCGNAHGNHVAGIAGAIHGNGIGIDGVIPQAKIDAVPWKDVLVNNDDPGATSEETRTTFFSQALVRHHRLRGGFLEYQFARRQREPWLQFRRAPRDGGRSREDRRAEGNDPGASHHVCFAGEKT